MSGFKYLTCLLFVALLSVTVQAEALIGYHSTLHRHMKRNKLQKCTQDLASQRFKDGHYTTLTAAICYRAGKGFKVYDGTEDHFRTGKLGTCYMKGLFGSRYSYDYTCYYLLGKNKFTAKGDGGYDNIAFEYVSGKCNWNSYKKELSCTD